MSAPFSDFKMRGLRFQYWFTAICATSLGLSIMLFPRFTEKLFMWKKQDDIIYGISGSAYFAFGLLSLLGLKNPKKWAPILLLQFTYKMAWFNFVVGRLIRKGELDVCSSWALIAGYAAFVAGDLWAVPFGYLLNSKAN